MEERSGETLIIILPGILIIADATRNFFQIVGLLVITSSTFAI